MKKLFTATTGFLILLACAAVVMWHSLCVIIASKSGHLQRSMVNRRLHQGSLQILKLIGATWQVNFSAGLNMQPGTPYILMANHLSLFDLPLLYATLPGTIRFLVKESLFGIPLFGSALRNSDFLPVALGQPEQMQALFSFTKQKLAQGIAIFLFPEGMRSMTGTLSPFKLGGFRLARETGALIIPIAISGTDKALPARTLSLRRGQNFSISVGAPIDSKQFGDTASPSLLMQQVETAIRELSQKYSP